jgi:hypothetical protein
MTEKKYIAETLRKMQFDPCMNTIANNSEDLTDVIEYVKSFWSYDLYTRKPGPAYDKDGVFKGTDLDLACFLYELAGRGAVINIPVYKGFRQKKFKEGQVLTSKENRHGSIISLNSNRNNFTFSVKIKDANIMSSDSIGDYRNFAITDFAGDWYDGWKTIQFLPDLNENKFMTENKLWSGNSIVFKDFIHPNRWTSFFGQYYFITKFLISRLTEERKYLNIIKKKMVEMGVVFPVTEGEVVPPKSYVNEDIDKGKQIKVDSFNVEVDFPKTDNDFIEYDFNSNNLLKVDRLWKKYGKDVAKLQFMTRATEYAHFKHHDRFPGWVKNTKWESGYKLKRKRIQWDRLVLFQPGVGEQAVAIRKRSFQKAERVREDYNESRNNK